VHIQTAFTRRETLSDHELDRLKVALVGEVERYREAIRGYSPEKMAKYGEPFLMKLQGRVDEVERLISSRR
jgi:hypothetical protein